MSMPTRSIALCLTAVVISVSALAPEPARLWNVPRQDFKTGFQVWAIAIFLIATHLKEISSMKLHRDLGITQKPVWFLAQRIREAFDFAWRPGFDGPIEADETFIGGKRKTMCHDKCKELSGMGRGPVGKAIVAGVRDRQTGQVSARVVKGTDGATLKGFVRYHVESGTTVHTDAALGYQGMTDMEHSTVNHGVGEYVNDMAHTKGVKSLWSMLKRGYQGIFHKVSYCHLNRYVNEFRGGHNIRGLNTVELMPSMATGMVGKRLTYMELIS